MRRLISEKADVLDCLLSDASSIQSCAGFEEWANEMGFDPDSRKAECIYKQAEKQTAKIQRLLGDDFEAFLYAENDV